MQYLIIFLLTFCLIKALTEEEIDLKWNAFKLSNKRRSLPNDEEVFRRNLFRNRIQQIEKHNERYRQGLETYVMGINKFADYTEDELRILTGALGASPKQNNASKIKRSIFQSTRTPSSIDWRSLGMVSPVKSQMNCGSCWAFAAVGALESQISIVRGVNVTLSEQQLVDCDPVSYGCNGGWVDRAYIYIQRNGGINHDNDYPYESVDNICRFDSKKPKISVKRYASVGHSSENTLKYYVSTVGPVAVSIYANNNFAYFEGGIYYDSSCTSYYANHAVVVVGYGSENGQDYWLVKNSWGSDWGDNGYIKMARNRNNNCGIANNIFYPVL